MLGAEMIMNQKIRKRTFETNSSSTHSLVVTNELKDKYMPLTDTIMIRWINTDEETALSTLRDKISYLVSHIAYWYKNDVYDYDELIWRIKNDENYKTIEEYVSEKYGKLIQFPEKYNGEIEEVVNINHQLVSYGNNLEEILEDIINPKNNYLEEVLEDGRTIEFDRD